MVDSFGELSSKSTKETSTSDYTTTATPVAAAAKTISMLLNVVAADNMTSLDCRRFSYCRCWLFRRSTVGGAAVTCVSINCSSSASSLLPFHLMPLLFTPCGRIRS